MCYQKAKGQALMSLSDFKHHFCRPSAAGPECSPWEPLFLRGWGFICSSRGWFYLQLGGLCWLPVLGGHWSVQLRAVAVPGHCFGMVMSSSCDPTSCPAVFELFSCSCGSLLPPAPFSEGKNDFSPHASNTNSNPIPRGLCL